MSEPLPDLPGCTHGVKSKNPLVIQCDGCLQTRTTEHGEPMVLVAGWALFPRHAQGDKRRMCTTCWKAEGVEKR